MNLSSSVSRCVKRALLLSAAVALSAHTMRAQDISDFTIRGEKDIFQREMVRSFAGAPDLTLPVLDVAVEYIRRYEGKDITYRRGPISLHGIDRASLRMLAPDADILDAPDARRLFGGGLLVSLPRAGETIGYLPMSDERSRYMLRVSIAPQSYKDATLSAAILIERAVVTRGEGLQGEPTLDITQSEVFTRSVEIKGNEPLHFSLPPWEIARENAGDVVPASLEEALLITLETPRYFGFTRNFPEPFSTSTKMTYAVPSACTVSLSIETGGVKRSIDAGHRETGVYHVSWNAKDLPDGTYTATLVARDDKGAELHRGTLQVTKDHEADSYRPPKPVSAGIFGGRISISTESGLAYQMPVDRKKALRHMFTHIAVRAGYRVSPLLEVGVLAGQDSFHEYPGPLVDIDRISEYGGVVPYTYGYIGPYARFTFAGRAVQPLAQASFAFTNSAQIAEIGAGVRIELFSRLSATIMPSLLAHFKSTVSTKIGIHYGIGVRL